MSGSVRRFMTVVLAALLAVLAAPPVANSALAQAVQPFPCDSTYYMMQPSAGASQLGRIAFPTAGGGTDTSFQPIATADFRFNAIGYNHVDNLMYGVIAEGAQIFRVDAAGTFTNLGTPVWNGVPITGSGIISGAFRANGEFLIRVEGEVMAIDVGVTPPRVVARATLPSNHRFADWAVNPMDNTLYGFDRNAQQLVRVSFTGGTATVELAGGTLPAGEVVEGQGTTWMDGNGRITFLGGREGGGHIDFYQAAYNPGTRTYAPLRKIGTEPALAGSGDGANCAFRMGFEKNASPATVTAGGLVTYTYDISNGTGQARTTTFTDDLTRPRAGGTFVPGSVQTPSGTVRLTNGDRTLAIDGLTVASGQTVRVTAQVRISPTAGGGVLYNQARLSGGGIPGGEVWSDFPGTPDPADATPVTVDPLDVDIAVSKNTGGVTENLVRPGDTFDYAVLVTNNGSDTSWPVEVTDTVPAPLLLVSASDGAMISGQQVRWTLGPVPPGAVVTRTITVRVDTDQAQTVVNTATATPADSVPGNNTSNEVITNIEIPIPQADLAITKSAPTTADPGGPLSYAITVSNRGPDRSGPSTVTDSLPPGYTVTGYTPGGTVSGTSIVWQLAPLAPGESVALTVDGVVPFAGGSLVNEAIVRPGQDGPVDPDQGNNNAQVTTGVREPAADLALTKAGPATVRPGATATYTLRVRNEGPDRSTGSTVRDTLPAGFTLVGTPPGATIEGDTIVWPVGELAVGAERVLSYDVTAPAEGGTGTNVATLTPAEPVDPVTGNNTAQVTTVATPEADLAISKSGPSFADAGTAFDWTIDVVNQGPSTARNVIVTDTVPAGFRVGAVAAPGAVTPNPDGTTTVRWVVGDLAVGAPVRLTVPVTAPNAAGVGQNSATVTSDTPDPDGTPPPATNSVPVRGFTLTKTVRSGPAAVRPGDEVVYEIVATNNGSVPYDSSLGLATFRDDLSEVLDDATLVSITPEAGITREDNGFTWTGPLPAGQSTTFLVTVRVGNGTGDGSLRNTVIGGTNCGPGSTLPACSPEDSVVRALALEKTASETVVAPGDELTYRVRVTNTGGYAFTAADPAVVTDDLSGVLDDAEFATAVTEPAGAGTFTGPASGTLGWSGPLAVGDSVTLVYTVTVGAPADGRIHNTVSSVDDPECMPGNGCGPSPTLVQAFALDKTVDRAAGEPVGPGDAVTYTVVALNIGQVAYEEATFTEDLTGVLDDAELVDVAADAGTVSLGDGDTVLRWTGPLAVGERATITVSVRVRNPNPDGDHSLVNVASGSLNCPADDAINRPACTAGDPLPVRGLTVTKTADATEVHAGDTVRYTIVITNTGGADYPAESPATAVDDMSKALDDGEYAGDATADTGEVAYDNGKLTWTGPLAVDATVTITYGINVAARGSGDHRLRNTVVATDSNCVPDGTDERCGGKDVLVGELAITKTADVAAVRPGGRVAYTVTVQNIGAADYRADGLGEATWTDDLSKVLDDARYTGDAKANAGSVGYEAPVLSWRGPVAAGQTATIVYSVEVQDPKSGDGVLLNTITAPDSACPCAVRTPVDATAPDPDLASTGTPVFWYLLIAFGLLAAGGAFFLIPVLRRRRKNDEVNG